MNLSGGYVLVECDADAAGREVRKAPSRENIKGIRETRARYGADACNGPNLTQC